METENSLRWIESGGGPLLLLEEHLLSYWRGFNFSKSHDFQTDYDRACEIDDYIGIITVDSEYGIVLGGEPLSTAWLPLSQTKGGLLVCWVFAENEVAVIDALANLPDVEWENTGVEIKFSGDKLILFDSAYDGSQIDEMLEIEIPKGRYNIETLEYEPNNQTSLILHRFKPNENLVS